jgi:FkbM family methyltransferase
LVAAKNKYCKAFHAFEPNPRLTSFLESNFSFNKLNNYMIHNFAISNATKKSFLNVSDTHSGNGELTETKTAIAFTVGNEIRVNARIHGIGISPWLDDYRNLKQDVDEINSIYTNIFNDDNIEKLISSYADNIEREFTTEPIFKILPEPPVFDLRDFTNAKPQQQQQQQTSVFNWGRTAIPVGNAGGGNSKKNRRTKKKTSKTNKKNTRKAHPKKSNKRTKRKPSK